MSESCDIVVIGGGPGGSACATLLADQGFGVTLLERALGLSEDEVRAGEEAGTFR